MVTQHSLPEQASVPSAVQQVHPAAEILAMSSMDSSAAPNVSPLRRDASMATRKSLRARQKWDDPFSLLCDLSSWKYIALLN